MLEANEGLENIFENAVKEAEKRRHEYVTIEHVLLSLIKELSANADGLWATCQVICLAHPQLWKELWSETQYRRLWQESIPLTVLLGPSDINVLEERLHDVDDAQLAVQHGNVPPLVERQARMRNVEGNHIADAHVIASGNFLKTVILVLYERFTK